MAFKITGSKFILLAFACTHISKLAKYSAKRWYNVISYESIAHMIVTLCIIVHAKDGTPFHTIEHRVQNVEKDECGHHCFQLGFCILMRRGFTRGGRVFKGANRTKSQHSQQNENWDILVVHTIVAVYSSSVEQNHTRHFEKQTFKNSKKFMLLWHGTQLYIHIRYHCVEPCSTNMRLPKVYNYCITLPFDMGRLSVDWLHCADNLCV